MRFPLIRPESRGTGARPATAASLSALWKLSRPPLVAATSFQVKFHRLTLPRTVVTLRLEHDRARNRVQFAYRKPDQVLLTSGSIRLGAP